MNDLAGLNTSAARRQSDQNASRAPWHALRVKGAGQFDLFPLDECRQTVSRDLRHVGGCFGAQYEPAKPNLVKPIDINLKTRLNALGKRHARVFLEHALLDDVEINNCRQAGGIDIEPVFQQSPVASQELQAR